MFSGVGGGGSGNGIVSAICKYFFEFECGVWKSVPNGSADTLQIARKVLVEKHCYAGYIKEGKVIPK